MMHLRSSKYYYRLIKTPKDFGTNNDPLQDLLDEINQKKGKIVSVLQHSSREFTVIYKI